MQTEQLPIEADSEEGIIIGLIDSIINTSTLLRKLLYQHSQQVNALRDKIEWIQVCGTYGYGKPIEDALTNLHEHEALYLLLQQFGFNRKIISEQDRKHWDIIDSTIAALKSGKNALHNLNEDTTNE